MGEQADNGTWRSPHVCVGGSNCAGIPNRYDCVRTSWGCGWDCDEDDGDCQGCVGDSKCEGKDEERCLKAVWRCHWKKAEAAENYWFASPVRRRRRFQYKWT